VALAATSRSEYRTEVLRRFIVWTGGDSGLIHQHFPTTAPFETGTYEGMDLTYVRRCVEGWDPQYSREMAPVVRASIDTGGATLDSRSLSARSRLAFYADVMEPSRVREGMFAMIRLGDVGLALCIHNRTSKLRFSDLSLETIRDLIPLFALGDRMLGKRAQAFNDEVPIAKLSRREREVAELLTLGYTNREIALALGSSIHTVRNQMASLFRKAGASTRAELVGIIRARGPE
jgi:DNA-binding CsgD family transcriptional regulator